MAPTLRVGDEGPLVKTLQRRLNERGCPVEVDGDFGALTYAAVRAFQAQNLDWRGQPLEVDGVVGGLTWWSLEHPKPDAEPTLALDFTELPPPELGGSRQGRAALRAAIAELRAGAGEVGGNNKGPFVRKYLDGRADEGQAWCAAFVSWCFDQPRGTIPFQYTLGARDLLAQARARGWARPPGHGAAARLRARPGRERVRRPAPRTPFSVHGPVAACEPRRG